MASVVWDAADVLQVYHYRRCIGTTKKNTRCSLTIKEPRLSAIAPLLNRMSRNSPELVTEQTLFQLADLCLCRTYHADQAYEFARLWTSVVKEVVSVEQRKLTLQNEITTLFQQTLKLQRLVSNLQADLDAEKRANVKAQKQFKRDAKGWQEEIMNLEQDLQASEDRNNVGEAKLSASRRNLQELQVHALNYLLARNTLETENKSLKADIVDAQKKLDDYLSIKQQNHDLGNQAKSFEHKIKEYLAIVEDTTNKAHASEEKVAAERAAKEAMENRYKAQIAEQEAEITELKSHREKLEHSVARLQASVKTCWWHRFRAWKDRFRKRDRSGSWVSITDESAEDITLRTYS
jgi:predicted  nucleic acid-binding Zn-ribbon protein